LKHRGLVHINDFIAPVDDSSIISCDQIVARFISHSTNLLHLTLRQLASSHTLPTRFISHSASSFHLTLRQLASSYTPPARFISYSSSSLHLTLCQLASSHTLLALSFLFSAELLILQSSRRNLLVKKSNMTKQQCKTSSPLLQLTSSHTPPTHLSHTLPACFISHSASSLHLTFHQLASSHTLLVLSFLFSAELLILQSCRRNLLVKK